MATAMTTHSRFSMMAMSTSGYPMAKNTLAANLSGVKSALAGHVRFEPSTWTETARTTLCALPAVAMAMRGCLTVRNLPLSDRRAVVMECPSKCAQLTLTETARMTYFASLTVAMYTAGNPTRPKGNGQDSKLWVLLEPNSGIIIRFKLAIAIMMARRIFLDLPIKGKVSSP